MNVLELLSHIKSNIPFYNEIEFFSADDIANLPIVNKHIIRDNYRLFISDELGDDKDKLVKFFNSHTEKAKGWYNEIGFLNDIIIEETSGTSGTPFLCAKTIKERNNLALALWSERFKRDKYITPKNLFQFSHIGKGHENPNAYNYNPEHLNKLYKKIQDEKVRWIHGTPSAFINHIKVLKENDLKFDFTNLKFIECTGYYLKNDIQREIENYFGVTVINEYGCIETWPIALSCGNNILHVNEKAVYIEIIDEQGNVINEYDKIGRLVVTTLYNKIFPLIRYDVGDFVKYTNHDNCGIKSKTISLIEGRAENIIKGLNSTKFGNQVFLEIVKNAKFAHKNIDLRYIQFIQIKDDKFVVNINYFDEVYDFISTIKVITQKEFEKTIYFDINFLSDDNIKMKNYEKPNIFLCKY